ncbi:MAG: shikimate dehydrogenase [Muribaculaceae bacterium]|nr:shikimate dehydrogenase [Muribaculaceae bacterium]
MVKERYGLIGKSVSHSFSATYFNSKFEEEGISADYRLFDIPSADKIADFVAETVPELNGFNITSPYKRDIIKYLDEITDEARRVNAVNLVKVNKDAYGRISLKGYNTDIEGFKKSLEGIDPKVEALVLGTGGASSAVCCGLDQLGIDYKVVSRTPAPGEINYDEANRVLGEKLLIINATPVGMFPNIGKAPAIDYEKLTPKHICYDLIYNPEKTLFLEKAEARGARIINGLEMLYNQAEIGWEIWQSNSMQEG